MINIVLDTNIIFSAVAFDKFIEELVNRIFEDNGLEIFVSKDTLQELQEKFNSKKFYDYRKLNQSQILEILEWYSGNTIMIDVYSKVSLCRDKRDNKFLELAKDCNADYLITGDKDLLELINFENTEIMSPSNFLKSMITKN